MARHCSTPHTYLSYQSELDQRQQKSLLRQLRLPSPQVHDFANNDYLQLSQHPDIIAAGQQALAQYGTSSSASPLITGYTLAHEQLNQHLCQWYGLPHSLLWNSGYAANQAILSTLPQKGDLILADRLIHHSMVQGILRSSARFMRYRHNDLNHLSDLLQQHRSQYPRIFVVTESVFSMDGDSPDLQAIAQLKEHTPFIWLLDEAHAVGWYGSTQQIGCGLAAQAGVIDQVDILVGTLGKALASHGAYTLFQHPVLPDYLMQYAGDFIYSTYLPPSNAAIAQAAINWIQDHIDTQALQKQGFSFRQQAHQAGIITAAPNPTESSPVVPIPVGDNDHTLQLAQQLLKHNFRVGAIRPPTVPADSARLRISLKADLPRQTSLPPQATLQQELIHCLHALRHG